ncbi:membrane protein insertion efficiency factor YidD [uncultured Tateyamaria sp.]|uniref:membrane protein insertion efficiency factor YidD n=1 Tax=uncultured Tateyamaria sp. TaxID=455651 RepID=UPI002612682C|nr:membrane protein insertion efficiency factor YidD [uncultured Tateyamaria sp.]
MLSRAALSGIWAYQRFVSPRKGFSCAYRVAHGGTGCSGFAKAHIRDHGLLAALPVIRRRFAACKAAALHLRTEDDPQERRRKPKKSRWYDKCDPSLCCGCDPSPCGRGKSDAADGCGGCDACACSP